MMHGLTDNYLRVEAPLRRELINRVVPVRLVGIHPEEPELMTGEFDPEIMI